VTCAALLYDAAEDHAEDITPGGTQRLTKSTRWIEAQMVRAERFRT
jgi:hypothetical protein